MRIVAWVVALVVLFLPGAGMAQVEDDELEKLPDVSILVEDLDDADAKCNITKSALDAAVRVPIDASRLGIREPRSSDGSWLYLNVGTLERSSFCMASVGLELRRGVYVKSTGKFTAAGVWSAGTILSGPAYDFGQRVNASVRELTDQFLAEWIKQNPKPQSAPN